MINLKIRLHHPEELDAAAQFCTALAASRRTRIEEIKDRAASLEDIMRGPSAFWQNSNEPPARTVAQREAEAEPVEEKFVTNTPRAGESEEQTQARRGRGRPRKNPVTIDGESTLVSETMTAAEPEQIDLEDVIAKQSGAEMAATLPDDTEPEGNILAGKTVEQTQPADPDKGWTHDDAKAVARQMYVRLGLLQQHELDERLHNNLQKFGVQRIKDLVADKIEAFVRGIESEVA